MFRAELSARKDLACARKTRDSNFYPSQDPRPYAHLILNLGLSPWRAVKLSSLNQNDGLESDLSLMSHWDEAGRPISTFLLLYCIRRWILVSFTSSALLVWYLF